MSRPPVAVDVLVGIALMLVLPLGLLARVSLSRSARLRPYLAISTIGWCWAMLQLGGTLFPDPGNPHLRWYVWIFALTGLPLYMLLFCVCAAKALRRTWSVRTHAASVAWIVVLACVQLAPISPLLSPAFAVLALVPVLLFAISNYARLGGAPAVAPSLGAPDRQ